MMNPNAWSKIIPKAIQRGLRRQPLNSSTEIRLTRLCAQRCRQCGIHQRKTQPATMTWEQFQILSERLKEYGAYIGFISGGEATLVPHLDKILIASKKIFQLATTLVTGLVNKTETIRRIAEIALDNDIHIQTSLDGLGSLGDDLRGVKNFSQTVLNHMAWIAHHRGNSKSLLYANIVMNNKNLEQIPEVIQRVRDVGWKTTIGLYHSLTETTRRDSDLEIKPGKRLDELIRFLDDNSDILNLKAFITGIPDFVRGKPAGFCAFVDAPVLATRTTIMENGEMHLCHGGSIGNVFRHNLHDIFAGQAYRDRIEDYRKCKGCWTTCYTQRYLLIRPRSLKELLHNIKKIRKLKAAKKKSNTTRRRWVTESS